MSLALGVQLGPYEVTSLLGSGGMGEVYRARDTKLNRDVALKVLPDAFTLDPDRLARFRREAQVLASLKHPNIGAIYGFEEQAAVQALVLELVDGTTLAGRIAQGPVPLDEALPIARQIAQAIEAAHEQGIIHRDLKPANIKLRPDGTVKVLDFGLAKALEPAHSLTTNPTMSPTVTARGTHVGVIVGTAAYMAPEQAKGQRVDKRTDIWAFGVVLYEMLTGRRPFEGETVTDVVAAVLARPPDWNVLPAATPAPVRRLLRRCLEKDSQRRLRDIADAAIEIDEALQGPSTDEHVGTAAASPARHGRRAVAFGVGALALVGLAGGALWQFKTPAATSSQIARFVVPLPLGQSFPSLAQPVIAISPDGRRLAYAYRWIYVRDMEQLEMRTIATPTPAGSVFFSPDGEWLGYSSTGQLLKVPVTGGTPQVLTGADPTGATWTDDDTIVFADANKGLFRVASAGGTPELLFPVEPPTLAAWPQVLPGGQYLL